MNFIRLNQFLLNLLSTYPRKGRTKSKDQKQRTEKGSDTPDPDNITVIEVSENRLELQCRKFDTDRQDDIEKCRDELNALAEKGIRHGTEASFNHKVNSEKSRNTIRNARQRYEAELNQKFCQHRIDVETDKYESSRRLETLKHDSRGRKLLEHHVSDYIDQSEAKAEVILEPEAELKKKLTIVTDQYKQAVQDYNYLKEVKYGNEVIDTNIVHSNFYFVVLGITIPVDAQILEKCFITTQIEQADTLNVFLAWFFSGLIAVSAHFTGQYIGYGKRKTAIWFASITILVMLFLASQRAVLESSITMTLANVLIYGLGTLLSVMRHEKWDVIKAKREMEKLKETKLDLEMQIKDINNLYKSELNRSYQTAEYKIEERRRFEIQITESMHSQLEKRLKMLDQLKADTKELLRGMEQYALDLYDTYFRNTNTNDNEAA